MVKDKKSVRVMAAICFLMMPFTIRRGAANLLEMWDVVESLKLNVLANLSPSSFLVKYVQDITIKSVNHYFSMYRAAMIGFGYATMIYCVSKKDFGDGIIIALLADGESIFNRIVQITKMTVNVKQFIVLAIPFAIWLCITIVEEMIKKTNKVILLAIVAIIVYWGIYSYLDPQRYFNFNLHFAIMASFAILGSVAMQQLEL